MTRRLVNYPGWYPACDTCGCAAGTKCIDRKRVGAEARLEHPHPGRKKAQVTQVQKRGLRERAATQTA